METRNNIQFGEMMLADDKPFLIAEAGVNYENDINMALRYVEEAAASGADAIKFQSYKAETLASKYSPSYWDTAKEPTGSQYDLFKNMIISTCRSTNNLQNARGHVVFIL